MKCILLALHLLARIDFSGKEIYFLDIGAQADMLIFFAHVEGKIYVTAFWHIYDS